MSEIFNLILAFTTLNDFWKALLAFVALYVLVAAITLLVMVIRRKTKRWRGKTMLDILTFKCISLSYAVASLCFLIFRPCVAVFLWASLGWLLIKHVLAADMKAMAYFAGHSSYEAQPFEAIRRYRRDGAPPPKKGSIKVSEREPMCDFGRDIYLTTCLLCAVSFVLSTVLESARSLPIGIFLVDMNLAAFGVILMVYRLIRSLEIANGHHSLVCLLCGIIILIAFNVLILIGEGVIAP